MVPCPRQRAQAVKAPPARDHRSRPAFCLRKYGRQIAEILAAISGSRATARLSGRSTRNRSRLRERAQISGSIHMECDNVSGVLPRALQPIPFIVLGVPTDGRDHQDSAGSGTGSPAARMNLVYQTVSSFVEPSPPGSDNLQPGGDRGGKAEFAFAKEQGGNLLQSSWIKLGQKISVVRRELCRPADFS